MKFIKKHKKIFVVTTSVLCLLSVIITISYRQKPNLIENTIGTLISPFQKVFSGTTNYFKNKISFLNNIIEIENQNYDLKKKVAELTEETNRLNYLDDENKKLASLLELELRYPQHEKVGAYVVAKDMSTWYDVFIIDKGTMDGIQKNMIVLADGGLCGKILEAGLNYSKVVGIIDDTSVISAKNNRTDDFGLVRGDINLMLEGLCIMEDINVNAEIVENDEIITSTLSKYYPPGLLIGHVREIKTDSKGLTKTAIVEPAVDFKNIETVLIIKNVFEKDIDQFINSEEN